MLQLRADRWKWMEQAAKAETTTAYIPEALWKAFLTCKQDCQVN